MPWAAISRPCRTGVKPIKMCRSIESPNCSKLTPEVMPTNVSAWAPLKLLFTYFPTTLHSQNASANCWNGTSPATVWFKYTFRQQTGGRGAIQNQIQNHWVTHISKQSKPKNGESIPFPLYSFEAHFFKQFYSKVSINRWQIQTVPFIRKGWFNPNTQKQGQLLFSEHTELGKLTLPGIVGQLSSSTTTTGLLCS